MLRKKIATFVVAAVMAAMSVIPALAATIVGDYSVEMYGYVADKYDEDGYVASAHASALVSSVTVNEDGDYVVVFEATASGYISSISTEAGEVGVFDESDNSITLVFAPEYTEFTALEVEDGVLVDTYAGKGVIIEYTVSMGTRHSTSDGALYIVEN